MGLIFSYLGNEKLIWGGHTLNVWIPFLLFQQASTNPNLSKLQQVNTGALGSHMFVR